MSVYSIIEANLFIVCASIPTLRRFLTHMGTKYTRYSTNRQLTSRSQRSQPPQPENDGDNQQFGDEEAEPQSEFELRTREEVSI